MHAQPNDDIDPYTLYVTADVATREHNCVAAVRAVLVVMLDYKTPVLDYVRPGAATAVRSELEQLLEFAGVDVPQIEDVA